MDRVLFVCQANVCRSPAMAIVFTAAVVSSGLEILATSAGCAVIERESMCARAATAVATNDLGARLSAEHRARPVNARGLSRAGLIICATREERSAVALMEPETRARAFTLREAVLLAALSPDDRDEANLSAAPTTSLVSSYAALLHGRRGRLQTTAPTRPSRWRRPVANPLDIVDAHSARPRLHAATIATVRELSSQLASGIAAFADSRAASVPA